MEMSARTKNWSEHWRCDRLDNAKYTRNSVSINNSSPTYGDIFFSWHRLTLPPKEAMNLLLGDLEYVRAVYIDDILVIQKENKSDKFHLQKLTIGLKQVKNTGLKLTWRNLSLCKRKLNTSDTC